MERHSDDATDCEVVCSPGHISVSGEIDIANAAAIGRRIRAAMVAERLVVDCRAVTFLDVAALRMLTHLGAAARATGTVVCLRCSPAVAEMLDLCGLRELP